ncbi:hypothetical protein NDU88_003164 [Pleurodeles waltl]|uniref:Uncharacterized protein n=1 Tax=Pleurodeles waltl TaxID=8319 RepID=A0AAV7RFS8_PLEWA|nr:hypothetical protein NDU88_003164 [Pleurodeles waltl]
MDTSPMPGVHLLGHLLQKRKDDKPLDLRLLEEYLKKAFTGPEPSVEDSPQGHSELLLEDRDSPDEAGLSQPWCPSPKPEDPKSHKSTTDMLELEDLIHLHSSEWSPMDKVAQYVARRFHKPLDKEIRAGLKTECPCLSLPGKVAFIHDLDPRMGTFLQKYMKDPNKGFNRSWYSWEDKHLDVSGPLTKILDLSEEAQTTGTHVFLETLKLDSTGSHISRQCQLCPLNQTTALLPP